MGRLKRYSPVVNLSTEDIKSKNIPPITDTGIRDFFKKGIYLYKVFPTRRPPIITATNIITGQTVVLANDNPLDIHFSSFSNYYFPLSTNLLIKSL